MWGDARVWVDSDAQREVIDFLDGIFGAVGAWYPTEANPEAPQIPFIAVADDGSATSTAVSVNTTIRVTVWDDNPTPAKNRAALALGHLLAHPGNERVYSISRGVTLAPVRDDRTNHFLASFTVIVAMQPTAA